MDILAQEIAREAQGERGGVRRREVRQARPPQRGPRGEASRRGGGGGGRQARARLDGRVRLRLRELRRRRRPRGRRRRGLAVAADDPRRLTSLDALETIRRLRAPAIPRRCSAKTDRCGSRRLVLAQASVAVEDEHAGGQQANERQKELTGAGGVRAPLGMVRRSPRGEGRRRARGRRRPPDVLGRRRRPEARPPGSSSKPRARSDPDRPLWLAALPRRRGGQVAARDAPKRLHGRPSACDEELLGEWGREGSDSMPSVARTRRGRRSSTTPRRARASCSRFADKKARAPGRDRARAVSIVNIALKHAAAADCARRHRASATPRGPSA